MRLKIAVIGIIFTIFSGIALTEQSKAQETVSIDLFYQELSPHGEWSPHEEFGYVWQPYEVGPEWKPYTDGRWEWSNQGWLWISYEPWGWATYHYGRWVYDDYQGWLWIPGTSWAPAWVSWQQSPEYIGWSPLPPDRGFFIEIGFVFNSYKNYYYKPYRHKYYGYKHHHHKHRRHKKHRYYHDYYNNPHYYKPPAKHAVFLPHNKFGHHKHAGKAAIPPAHYDVVLRNSRNVTNIKRVNNKVINYGPDKHFIEKRSNRKLRSHNIVNRNNIKIRGNKNVNIIKGGTYNAYKPKIERSNRDPFTTNRNQINKYGSNRKNTKNSLPHKQTQLNKTSTKSDLRSNYKNQRSYKPSVKTPFSKDKVSKQNPTTTNRKINNRYQQKNISKNKPNTATNGHNRYGYKNHQQKNTRQSQKPSNIKTHNIQKKKVYLQKQSNTKARHPGYETTNRLNNNDKTQYRQNSRSNNQQYRATSKKYDNKNYSKKKNQSSSKKARVSKSRSYKPNVRTMQTPQNPAFSRR